MHQLTLPYTTEQASHFLVREILQSAVDYGVLLGLYCDKLLVSKSWGSEDDNLHLWSFASIVFLIITLVK